MMHLRVYVVLQDVLLIQVYSVSNQIAEVEFVIKLLSQLPIQKLKVVHVVRCLKELVLRIKQRVRVRHVILVLVIQWRMKSRGRAIHLGVSGTATMVCATTQNPPPQHPVPPTSPVYV